MVQIMNEKSFFICSRDMIWEAYPGNGVGVSSFHTFLHVALPFLEQVCNKLSHRKLSEISLTFLFWNDTFIGKKEERYGNSDQCSCRDYRRDDRYAG